MCMLEPSAFVTLLPMPDLATTSVLLIDDDAELCLLVKEFLESLQFQVETVHDGPGGLARALATTVDLILLDVMLPRLEWL